MKKCTHLFSAKDCREAISLFYGLCYLLENEKVFERGDWLETDKAFFKICKEWLSDRDMAIIVNEKGE